MIKGISIPIAFEHTGRGNKYKEVEVYFSFTDIKNNEIDILEPGGISSKNIQALIKKSSSGNFDYLIPYTVKKIENYDAPHGIKYSIGLIDKNPTTATLFHRIGFFPCSENNLKTILNVFDSPDFYLGVKNDKLYLYIKNSSEYVEIPSQNYSPSCWRGFAHPSITLDGEGTPMDYTKLNWAHILNEIIQAYHEKTSKIESNKAIKQ